MNSTALQHSLLAAFATLFFTFAMSLPGVCALAMAKVEEDGEWSCSCLGSSEDEGAAEADECCCGCGPVTDGQDRPDVEPVLSAVAPVQEEHLLSPPTLWWTPKLVATLWLVDTLATSSVSLDPTLPPVAVLPLWDQSDLYLKNSTLLI